MVGLEDTVFASLEYHFDGYNAAAVAQREYARLMNEIDTGAPNLFGAFEAARAGLEARPPAKVWRTFQKDAEAAIAPFCFSIRFLQTGDAFNNEPKEP